MKKNILILVDWRGYLSGKFEGTKENHVGGFINVEKICSYLSDEFNVKCDSFMELDLSINYAGWYVIYASSEERGLMYKQYIEDILLRLKEDGAVLVPDFKWFRAHGNKAFQELLRKSFQNDKLKKPAADVLGRVEEFNCEKYTNFPYVIKTSSGAGSCGVKLARNREELVMLVNKMSQHYYYDNYFTPQRMIRYNKIFWNTKKIIKSFFGKKTEKMPNAAIKTNKLIIQEFLENLNGDYKVLFYAGKYYVLSRTNRDNDFRASGSGKFRFPESLEEVTPILNFAREVVDELKVPMISMDVAFNGETCYLIEYQCLCFGPYTIQYSEWYFEYQNGGWIKINTCSEVEHEYARAIKEYISAIEGRNNEENNNWW